MSIENDAIWREIRRREEDLASARGCPQSLVFKEAVDEVITEMVTMDVTASEYADIINDGGAGHGKH